MNSVAPASHVVLATLLKGPLTINELAPIVNATPASCRTTVTKLSSVGLIEVVAYESRKTRRGNTTTSMKYGVNKKIFNDEGKIPLMVNTAINAGVSIPALVHNAADNPSHLYTSGIFNFIQQTLPQVLANRMWDAFNRSVAKTRAPKVPPVGDGQVDLQALKIMVELLDGMANGIRQIIMYDEWWIGTKLSQALDFPHWEQIADLSHTLGLPVIPEMFKEVDTSD